jgi:hypothetical protein
MYLQLAMSLRLIALMMEAVRTSETSVNSHKSTRGYNPEQSHLRSHRRGNVKPYSGGTSVINHLLLSPEHLVKQEAQKHSHVYISSAQKDWMCYSLSYVPSYK